MRKIASLVVTALLISNITGCSYRNTAMRNYPNTPNQGTTQGTRTGYQTGTTQGTYRDGVYSGVGKSGSAGNQTATVVIKGGRITNITLGTIDNRGVEMYPQNMGITQGTTGSNTGTTTGINTRNSTTNNYANQGARTYGTPGVTTGGMAGGMAGNVNDNNTIGNTGRTGVGTGYGNMGGTTSYGNNIGTTTGGTNNVGPNGSGQYNIAKKQIEAAMISAQTYDVNINGSNTNVGKNWKLAVRRALDRARY